MIKQMSIMFIVLWCFCGLSTADNGKLPQNLEKILKINSSFELESFPIGFWNYTNLTKHGKYMTQQEVQDWADAGFTLTQSSRFDPSVPEQIAHIKKMLDWAHEVGIKIILDDPRTQGPYRIWAPDLPADTPDVPLPDDYRQKAMQAVKDFENHPATFGFHVGDEPGKFTGDAYFKACRILDDLTEKQAFMNLLPWYEQCPERVGFKDWPTYLDAVVNRSKIDLLCYDCYSQMKGDFDMYFKNLMYYRQASWRNGVPFWTSLLSVAHWDYNLPNYDQLRWQFNTAICSGATGIQWFFYYVREPHDNFRLSPVDANWDKTQMYYDLKRMHKIFHRFYGDLFLKLVSTRVTFYPEAYGDGKVFSSNELVKELKTNIPEHPLLLGEFADINGRRFVMLVNNSMEKSVRAGIVFPGKNVKIYKYNWSGDEFLKASGENDLLEWSWLAPGQEAVFRVESDLIEKAAIKVSE